MADKSMDGLNTFTDQTSEVKVDTTKKMKQFLMVACHNPDIHFRIFCGEIGNRQLQFLAAIGQKIADPDPGHIIMTDSLCFPDQILIIR